MKIALKLIVIVCIIVFLTLSYVGMRKNHQVVGKLDYDWNQKIKEIGKNIDANTAMIDKNTTTIDSNTTVIGANTTLIDANTTLIDANTELIGKNATAIQTLSDAHKELANIVYAHGRKVNRVIWELVFKIAYGDTEKARITWNQYCKCTNLPLWEEAVSMLSQKEAEKLLKINEIQSKIQAIDDQLNQ